MGTKKIILAGNNLEIDEVFAVAADPLSQVEIAAEAEERLRLAQEFLKGQLVEKLIYGVNTGFGPMASHVLGNSQLKELQHNLIRSHAVGMGKPLYASYVLAAMVVRLNTLVRGYSGVSGELLERLQTLINNRVIPIVPEHGAVGTSGDLVQLAHIALALLGEGEVVYGGLRQPASKVLQSLGMPAYELKPKEGLALINGTAAMSGIGAVLAVHVSRLLSLALRLGGLALELVSGFRDSIAETLHSLRPHPGQQWVAQVLRELLSSSGLMRERVALSGVLKFNQEGVDKIPFVVQEVYSLRCIPQILGPLVESLKNFQKIIRTEINSVTDNPIVDVEGGTFLHGGNFHGDYVATAVDQLKIPVVKMTMLSERRINFFLNNYINRTFPPFLNLAEPGLTLGLQGLQFVATSTTAASQSLAFPHSLHSIPTNADNQDVVSMGTDAALLLGKVIENAYTVLAIELVTLAQAVDVLGVSEKLARPSAALYQTLRERFAKIEADRVITGELARLVEFLKQTREFEIELARL